ncbi:MAG: 30S ribosomal protein S12 methylthiotransferase RimO [Chlorobiaceae bacterium]|jgi:ribosomal protein S12 methylthiotransferase|nr:30S ribosomal protein S12 methylthiotransferase RimO [Chlorobiaceae bacterium]NTW63193.1 30S ribosomal protein S12 methylthiotransferase RimO [Chlorobiaceae bacterium]
MKKHNVFLLSLGCSKNTVDSERLMAQAEASGIMFTEEADLADTIIINTCGFIEDAKEESIAEILAAVEKKTQGIVSGVYVMGCLSELYRTEMREELPEVDGFFGTRELPALLQAIDAQYREELYDHRTLLTPPHLSYLKIAEGCNRSCSFCSIPKIRGRYRSQPMEQLLREAAILQKKGVQELNLIAQDTSLYGRDIYGTSMLRELLVRLSDMDFRWIRLLYAYPLDFPLEVITTMSERKNICNYLDLPLQHCNDRILRSMNRGITKTETIHLIETIRAKNPDIRLRTTMLVGFPGETREEFNELMQFIEEVRFDRLGCFPYCHEEHAPSFALEDTASAEEKAERRAEVMELQETIAEKNNRAFEGKELTVLIDQIEGDIAIARTEYDAPEVDNECYLTTGSFKLSQGQFCTAQIEESSAYELHGTITALAEKT